MKRHGTSLPWSGTRDAMVSSVSISAAVRPGPASSTGLAGRSLHCALQRSGFREATCRLEAGLCRFAAPPAGPVRAAPTHDRSPGGKFPVEATFAKGRSAWFGPDGNPGIRKYVAISIACAQANGTVATGLTR